MFSRRKRTPSKLRWGGIYRHPAKFVISPVNRTTAGVGISSEPVFILDADATAEDIGRAVRAALENFKDNIPHPTVWAGTGKSFLEATGFKSWKALETSSSYCSFSDDGEQITFESLAFGGTRGDKKGFQPFGAPDISLPWNAPDSLIGETAVAALDQSEAGGPTPRS